MPDYNGTAARFWWTAFCGGMVALLFCLGQLAQMSWLAWLQVAGATVLAIGAGMFPIRVPGTKIAYAAGEIFIFLLLLVLGPAAAAVAAAAEAFVGSARASRRWTSRLFSPASATLAMLTVSLPLQAGLAALAARGFDSAAVVLAATMAAAALYFLINASLLSGVLQLKRGEAFFQPKGLFSVFRWVGMAYAGSASVATLLFFTWRTQGVGVLLVMVPLLAMLLVTLHFYFRQQEAGIALREAGESAAAREAAMAEREAQAAARHLRELQASERRFHSAFTHASIGMALLGFDGRILQANPALAALLGRSEAELLHQPFTAFVEESERPLLAQQLGLASGRDFEAFSRELRCVHADGSAVWLSLNCSFFTEPVPDAEPATEAGAGQPCLILQAQDVSARRRAEAGLQHLAFHDPLTGLPNRRRFQECLVSALTRYQADPRKPWAVMFIDFDRFKLVNDSLGHNAGDALLQQVARRVQEKLRPGDIVARLGGDEFAILVTDIEHERDAVLLAERLMEALHQPFRLGEVELIATASIGITFSAIGYATAEEVLRDADTAMYKAKAGGKARYALFDTSLHAAVSDRLRLEGELRTAVEQGQLVVVYQPVFALRPGEESGRLTGFEALVRWQHPQDGLLPPAAFLPIAEESGLMLGLSDFVLHCACHQLRQWQLSDPRLAELTMSINLSAHDLAHPALVARIGRAIVEAGLRPQHLTLELTENILMSQIDGVLPTLAALRQLGVRLAVDDFGTGYSSLSHLSKLPIDSLKIDRSFVSQLLPGSDDAAVVSAIIQLGGTLRKEVVAEGIESAAQMAQLRELGCGYGQGFHMAEPLAAAQVAEWLREQRGALH
ncbi:putative bifunctional diguanylate cyclase/phosphodiesterase [Rubrivivax rivuli]|uniref:EAL domain-containing protein n=1 Tax=Rubrivivax rivuli TaxID=1862385 RepID=A0A437RRS9_9BURK|nr:EAL domain-containing protein [Rubrivivax rivuli]RVU49497.1 EAL domain-containing protein [Rubrivivax rivuli]